MTNLTEESKQGEATGRNGATASTSTAEEATPVSTSPDGDMLYCANHPTVETLLRCNRCNKPICTRCAVQTDVGFRCQECIRGVQDKYFNAASGDYAIAFFVGLAVAAIAAPIVSMLIRQFGFFGLIIAFIAGSGAGGALAQIIRSAVGKRRGRNLNAWALAGIILGILLGGGILGIILTGSLLGFIPGIALLFNLPMLLFSVLALATTFQLLR